VLVIVVEPEFLKKKPSPGTRLNEGLPQFPKRKVVPVYCPRALSNLNTEVPLGTLGNRIETVLLAPSSGLLARENPGGKLRFTNPTAFTEYTVWAKEEAALAAINNPAARRAFVFMSLFFLYFVCNAFVAEKRFSVNSFFLRTLP